MKTSLLPPVLQGGIEEPNYFNGRVLTAGDLRDGQRASLERARRLGQAIGEGVAYGLFVRRAPTPGHVAVRAGLAIARRGDALVLPVDIELPLTGTTVASAGGDAVFVPCAPVGATTTGAVTAGLYLLAIGAASGLAGRTRTTALNETGGACAARYEVEGVQLKLIALDAAPAVAAPLVRSDLVARCFGFSETLAASPRPFDAPPRYGIADSLRTAGVLGDCDVPLAVLQWTGGAISFVDGWAVRRRCAGVSGSAAWPQPATPAVFDEPWSQHIPARRAIEAEAFLLQFQEHLDEMRLAPGHSSSDPGDTRFRFLPAAGYLPTPTSTRTGFDWRVFFRLGSTVQPTELEPAFVRAVIGRSFFVDPIALEVGAPVPVDVFAVPGTDAGRPYLVFARRERVALPVAPTPEPAPEPEPEPEVRLGSLVALLTGGSRKLRSQLRNARVRAVERRNGTVHDLEPVSLASLSGPTERRLYEVIREAVARASLDAIDELDGSKRQPAVFLARGLPAGSYTVGAIASDKTAHSIDARVVANDTSVVVIDLPGDRVIRDYEPKEEVRPDAPWVTLHGDVIDKLYLHRAWPRDGLPFPPPLDWRVEAPRDVIDGIQRVLGTWLEGDPGLVVDDPVVHVRPDYTPETTYQQPYAFVSTTDGTLHPLVLVPSALDLATGVPVTQADLPDLADRGVAERLGSMGLGKLDALANAWGALTDSALGIGVAGGTTLVAEAREAVTGLMTSLERYPGVDKAASDALSAEFSDDVALANAGVDRVLEVLAAANLSYTRGFAERLVGRARQAVPERAWGLEAVGISEADGILLAEQGITSQGDLITRAAEVADILGLNEAALDRLTDRADIGMSSGRLRTYADAGVLSIEGVKEADARALAAAGIGTTTALAAADRTMVAEALGVTEVEATTIVALAQAATGGAGSVTELPGLKGNENATKALAKVGILTAGDLAAADALVVEKALGGDTVLADRVTGSARDLADVAGRLGGARHLGGGGIG